jgi:hypothetical protein
MKASFPPVETVQRESFNSSLMLACGQSSHSDRSQTGSRQTNRKANPSEAGLKIVNNITQSNAQRFGDFQEGVNRNSPVCTLDLANVNRVQIRFLSQLFLAQTHFLAVGPDIFTNQFSMFGMNGHNTIRKQEAAKRSHKLAG